MNAAIDTLATYDAIAAAGIDDRGARAISKAIADSSSVYREDLATKSDLEKLEIKLTAKLETSASEIRELIGSTQNRTLVWMFGMLVTFTGVIIAVVKLV